MSAARDNKFLIIFWSVIAVGSLALGVLLFFAYQNYSEVSVTYDKQATELARLQALKPFPDTGNLKALEAEKSRFAGRIGELRSELSGYEIPLEDVTPNAFQDRLREMVSSVVKDAAAAGVALPEKFYLGFNPYENELPSAAAAPALLRQLKSMDFLVRALINGRATSIKVLERRMLAVESGSAPSAAGVKKSTTPLVTSDIVRVAFQGEAGSVRTVLNNIVSAKSFFIVRSLSVTNGQTKGPQRGAGASAAASGSSGGTSIFGGAAGDAGAKAAGKEGRLQFILGKEKIDTDLLIEIPDFAEPDAAPAAKTAGDPQAR